MQIRTNYSAHQTNAKNLKITLNTGMSTEKMVLVLC